MAPSYDCAASILLCPENHTSILCLFDDGCGGEDGAHGNANETRPWLSSRLDGDLLMDFPLLSDECLALLVERESEFMPSWDYGERLQRGALDASFRRDAVEWISKVHAHYGFGPLSAYLAVNCLDRFLSAYELPQGKSWMTQLLSVACLSLATKMEETDVPLPLDLQVGEAKFVFEARTIQRMELLVLSTLKWRMQAVSPFSFIDYFLHKFNGGNAPSKLSISQSMDLILSITRGTEFLAFRPSDIAAAVALTVLAECQNVEIDRAASSCIYVEKERVLRCYEMIQDKMMAGSRQLKTVGSQVPSVPPSPIGVLDAACLSHNSDDMTAGSHTNCHLSSPASKRRRISR